MTRTLTERRDLERQSQFSKGTFRDPEKHYVRLNGWLPACRAIKQNLRDEEFRYFSLCGKEPFDVMLLFREGILNANWTQPNVAICDVEMEALTAAGEALTRAECGPVTKFCSYVEDLILNESNIHQQFLGMLPFHVYNFDFTKQIFYHKDPIQTRMWETIERIIELQSTHKKDFDLFITSRSHPPEINRDAVSILLETMNNNVNRIARLSELMRGRGINSFDELRNENFTEFFLRALPKQILQTAHDNGFLLELHGLFCYEKTARYKWRQYKYHIAKWCIGLRRPSIVSKRLSRGDYFAQHGFDNYCDTALALVNNDIQDVKNILAGNAQKKQEIRRDFKNLCQRARLPS
jgi:hypothetical protein